MSKKDIKRMREKEREREREREREWEKERDAIERGKRDTERERIWISEYFISNKVSACSSPNLKCFEFEIKIVYSFVWYIYNLI